MRARSDLRGPVIIQKFEIGRWGAYSKSLSLVRDRAGIKPRLPAFHSLMQRTKSWRETGWSRLCRGNLAAVARSLFYLSSFDVLMWKMRRPVTRWSSPFQHRNSAFVFVFSCLLYATIICLTLMIYCMSDRTDHMRGLLCFGHLLAYASAFLIKGSADL